MKKRSGQSILEYTLLLGVVIGVIALVLFGPLPTGKVNPERTGMKSVIIRAYQKSDKVIANTTANLKGGIFGNPNP